MLSKATNPERYPGLFGRSSFIGADIVPKYGPKVDFLLHVHQTAKPYYCRHLTPGPKWEKALNRLEKWARANIVAWPIEENGQTIGWAWATANEIGEFFKKKRLTPELQKAVLRELERTAYFDVALLKGEVYNTPDGPVYGKDFEFLSRTTGLTVEQAKENFNKL